MDKFVNKFAKILQKKIQNNDAFSQNWEIEVFEENGVVRLEGAVTSRKALEMVETFIQEQDGVKAVVNVLDIDETLAESKDEIDIDKEDYVPPIRNHPG